MEEMQAERISYTYRQLRKLLIKGVGSEKDSREAKKLKTLGCEEEGDAGKREESVLSVRLKTAITGWVGAFFEWLANNKRLQWRGVGSAEKEKYIKNNKFPIYIPRGDWYIQLPSTKDFVMAIL